MLEKMRNAKIISQWTCQGERKYLLLNGVLVCLGEFPHLGKLGKDASAENYGRSTGMAVDVWPRDVNATNSRRDDV